MKKVLLLLLTVLIASLHASAATPPSLSIEDFSIKAGETKELLVDLNNPDDQIANVQFTLSLPSGLSVAQSNGSNLVSKTERATAGHQIHYNAANGTVILFPMPVAAFTGNSGAIVSITLNANSSFTGGDIMLKGIVLATVQAVQYKPDDVVYTIKNNILTTGITLNATSKELTTGQTFQLSATVAPSNATNKSVKWSSSKTSVATVSSTGLVTAVAAGSATITCEAQDGSGVKATCGVTVKAQSSGNIIQFADAEVKRICVENWDTNGDGELSEDEAAAVITLDNVFKKNTSITTFTELRFFTGLEKIGQSDFDDCDNLSEVSLPNSLKVIGQSAFNSSGLESIDIPYGVTRIEGYAFRYCRSLKKVTIPNSVTYIGSDALEFCNNLVSISIPASVTSLYSSTLGGCANLKEIIVDADNPNYMSSEGILFNKDKTMLLTYPAGKTDVEYIVPMNVNTIDRLAFYYTQYLEKVTIHKDVASIGWFAFISNKPILSVTVESVEPIALLSEVFSSKTESEGTLYVPYGSKAAYQQADGWKNFQNIVEMEAPDITIALDDESKISIYWYAISSGQAGVNKDEIHVNPAVYGQAGANIHNWTYDVFSTFMSGRPKLTVTGADANSVTPLLAFRSAGSLQASSNGDALLCNADTIAKVNAETGVVTMVMSNSTMSLLNRAASNEYVNALTLPLCIKARYNGIVYDVEGGDFAAKVMRPINAEGKELAVQDITTGSVTLNLSDLVTLTDWRGSSINTRGLFDFYDIESITVMGATNSSNVGSAIMASVNGSWGSVSGATDKLTFAYQPKSLSANAAGTMPDYGTLTIANNGFSGDMQLLIPVTVSYAWGEVLASAYVTVTAAKAEPKLVMTEMNIEGDGIVGTPHTYTVYITNQGQGDFVGSVYVWIKKDDSVTPHIISEVYRSVGAGRYYNFKYIDNVDDGEEEDYFYFTAPGTYHFWLTTDAEGQQPVEGEKTFVVTPAATLTAKNYTREYGEENPDFGFTADKGGFSGTPKITCTADRYSDVGTYDIVIEQGSVDNNYVTLVPGTLTITKAPLTVSAGSWLNREGWEPAGITPKYENFKNGEDKSVLTKEPQFTTTATAESPMGSVHQLTFSGAEAKNYAFTYIPGTVTIIGRPGDVNRDGYINTTDAVDEIQANLGYNSLQDIYDGDFDYDKQITIADLASVVNYILNNDRAAARRTVAAATTNSQIGLTLDEQGRLAVTLRNDKTFTGFQFDVTLPDGADLSQVLLSELRRNGHSIAMRHMDDGSYRVLVYSMQNNALRGSDGVLATLQTSAFDGDVTLSNIHFADIDCVDHQLPDVSLSMLTGISTLTQQERFDIYDINGRLVRRDATSTKGLHRGVYMINNQKVVIK